MLLVWQHAEKNPEHGDRQPHPILCRTADQVAILRALGDNVSWRGRMLYLHTDSDDPRPETAFAMVGWAKIDDEWHWVADGPETHGFLRDKLFDWIERGMEWTQEQHTRARQELTLRGWDVEGETKVCKAFVRLV